jgi:hypothetical protein
MVNHESCFRLCLCEGGQSLFEGVRARFSVLAEAGFERYGEKRGLTPRVQVWEGWGQTRFFSSTSLSTQLLQKNLL